MVKKKDKASKRDKLMRDFILWCATGKFIPADQGYISPTQLSTKIVNKANETIGKIKKLKDK